MRRGVRFRFLSHVFIAGMLVALLTSNMAAQQRAVRDDGVTVILHPDGTWTVASEAVPAAAPSAHASSVRVFFGNLHSHTAYSDGSATPADAFRHARDVAGLDFLAVTEHNHRNAPSRLEDEPALYNGNQASSLKSAAARFTADGTFVAIYGQEFSSIGSGNHANVLEVDEVIQPSDVRNGAWDDLLNTWLPNHPDSQEQPAILLLNHPTIPGSTHDEEYGIDDFNGDLTAWRTALGRHASLINMVNGPSHDDGEPGSPSFDEVLRYLDMGFHLAPTADQDNHLENWGSAARTRTGVWATTLSKPAILDALRSRRAYATEDENLKLIGSVNGALMGEVFTGNSVPPPGPLTIELTIEDADEPGAEYTIDVFRNTIGGTTDADVVRQVEHTGDGTVTIPDVRYEGGDQYVFLRVSQLDESGRTDHAWLAPVWFEPAGTPGPGPTPGPTPGPAIQSVALEVDVFAEEATITNTGTTILNLRDWTLMSTIGVRPPFRFTNRNLAPGESVTVTSGSGARTGPGFVRWTLDFVWRNSGDPGQLLDPTGTIRAESP